MFNGLPLFVFMFASQLTQATLQFKILDKDVFLNHLGDIKIAYFVWTQSAAHLIPPLLQTLPSLL